MSHPFENTSNVDALIEAHRAAVLADEANFTDDGEPVDAAAADASHTVEIDAYRALVAAHCDTDQEVQAKLGYFLHGSVGMRTTLTNCLMEPCYAPLGCDESLEIFLTSLLIGDGEQADATARQSGHGFADAAHGKVAA